MRWFSRKTRAPAEPARPPRGVTLHYEDRVIACDVLRDEGQDRRGRAVWLAVPRVPVVIRQGEEYEVTAEYLPDGCDLIADFAQPSGEDTEEWWLPDAW